MNTFCTFSNHEQKMDDDYLIRVEKVEENDLFKFPPGFRFHPTDEELITNYLSLKALDCGFISRAIGEVDLNRVEPWELPRSTKMREKEWYFFCVRDRKYPTGLRMNRATEAGYWKATGKDKEIYRMKVLVGMKKTLVFYMGRAPKGVKTNWVMHEYRLEGSSSHNLQNYSKNEWVICRVFQKTPGGKRADIPVLIQTNEFQNSSTVLPPLTDSSPYNCNSGMTTVGGNKASHVSCFSDLIVDAKTAKTMSCVKFQKPNVVVSASNPEYPHCFGRGQHRQELNSRMLMQSSGTKNLNQGFVSAPSCFDRVDGGNHLHPQPVDLDCSWQY